MTDRPESKRTSDEESNRMLRLELVWLAITVIAVAVGVFVGIEVGRATERASIACVRGKP